MSKAGRWTIRVLVGLLIAGAAVVVLAVGALLYLQIPQNAAGMAAKSICSAHFVSGREGSADELMAQELAAASPAFSLVSTSIDDAEQSVSARFLGVISRRATLMEQRGCVLDGEVDAQAQATVAGPADPAPWPAGDGLAEVANPELEAVLDAAMVGAGDVAAANTRAVAVVQGDQLVGLRTGPDFTPQTPQHGWSMTKTVAAMLFYARAQEVGLDLETPVVDAFRPGREPGWVADWRADERADITVADLLYMRDGLQNDEGYGPTGAVVAMLYGAPDMAAWAADHPVAAPAGTSFQYLSATANLLADVAKGQFDSDADYWAYPQDALFGPLGIDTATLETDAAGTWVGSSYLWADVLDWARLGRLMMADGQWDGSQVLPAGWLTLATTPAMADGEGHGYGAQTWLLGDPIGGECRAYPGVPEDTVAMEGHWGQLVAMVPSRDAQIVRLGWTFESDVYDQCQLISDVLAALPEATS